MPIEYLACSSPNLLMDAGSPTGQTGYISYRMVICHAIHFFTRTNDDRQAAQNLVQQLLNIETNIDIPNLFLSYNFSFHNQNLGVVLIDRTRGSYPLVLYNNTSSPEQGNGQHIERLNAFMAAIRNIDERFDDIFRVIINSQEFDQNLFNELASFFEFGNVN